MKHFFKKRYFGILFAFLFLIEVYSLFPPGVPKHPLVGPPPAAYLKGIVHVHSNYSWDAGGTVDEITRAANETGMDFVVLTDHLNSQARRDGFERRFDTTDLFVEMEASVRVGHVLTFYTHTDAADVPHLKLNEMAREQIFGIRRINREVFQAISHPTDPKRPFDRLDLLAEGIEVINLDSLWRRESLHSPFSFFCTAVIFPFNNFLSTLRYLKIHRKNLEVWDHMNSVSKGHFGILGHDTHQKIHLTKTHYLPWPKYKLMFSLASNIVFYDPPLAIDFQTRKKQIYRAIRKGRMAMVFQLLHPFEGNDWSIRCDNQNYRSGSTAPFAEGKCRAVIRTPDTFPYPLKVSLWKDGTRVAEHQVTQSSLEIPLSAPGVYRVELWASMHTRMARALGRDVPYLFYNPIYVR